MTVPKHFVISSRKIVGNCISCVLPTTATMCAPCQRLAPGLPVQVFQARAMTKTIRQTIVALLEREALSTLELADILLLKEKEIAEHLEHISRSLRPQRLVMVESARCKKCGFQFKKRSRLSPPSRCPRCKSECIERARLSIV